MEGFIKTVTDSEDVVIVTKAEPGYPIFFVNRAFTAKTGYKEDEVLGRNPSFLYGPDTSRRSKLKIKKAITQFTPIRQEIINYTKTGEAFPTEVNIFPYFDDGECTYMIFIYKDIAAHRIMERNLKEYKKFFDATPVAFLRTDLKTGQFLMANEFCAEILGYSSVSELMDEERAINLYRHKEDRRKLINRLKKQGSVQNYELELRRRDGTIVWISASLHINCGGSCIEGSLIDISDKKLVERELEILKEKHLERLSKINDHLDTVLVSYAN